GRLPYRSAHVALRVSPLDGSCPRGHDKSELGAAAGRAAHADRAAVCLDETFDDVQAQTGAAAMLASAAAAAGLAAPELTEHPGRHVRRDALALVAHGNGDRVEFSLFAVHMCRFHRDCYDTSAVPDGIFHQVAGRPLRTSSRNRSSASPAATRPAMIFLARSGRSTSCRWTSIRPDSIRDTSSSSVMSLVTRSASAFTVSSITRFWSSVNRPHLASSVAVKPFTLVS